MSSPSATHTDRTSGHDGTADGESDDQSAVRMFPSLTGPIRVASFWTAIVLPFLHVPLLATGLATAAETTAFLTLLALNLIALYVGHSHRN